MNRLLHNRWRWAASAMIGGLSAACSVNHCERGAVGCVDGPTRDDGSCQLDLVAQGGRCVRDQDLLTGDAAAALPDVCGRCKEGLICASDQKKCLDFCASAADAPMPTAPPDRIVCGGEARDDGQGTVELSFEQTCRNACELDCRRWKDLCDAPCESDACQKPEVLARCNALCDGELACMQSLCSDARARGCVEGAVGICPPGKSPDCEGVLCTNACPIGAFDGVCDDGEPASAQTASCAFGTDCADCGPRKSADEPPSELERALATPCSFHEQCAGFSPNFALNDAFCAPVSKARPQKRCLRDCSGDDELCPLGSVCTTLKSNLDGEVLEDGAGRKARACVPSMCD